MRCLNCEAYAIPLQWKPLQRTPFIHSQARGRCFFTFLYAVFLSIVSHTTSNNLLAHDTQTNEISEYEFVGAIYFLHSDKIGVVFAQVFMFAVFPPLYLL